MPEFNALAYQQLAEIAQKIERSGNQLFAHLNELAILDKPLKDALVADSEIVRRISLAAVERSRLLMQGQLDKAARKGQG